MDCEIPQKEALYHSSEETEVREIADHFRERISSGELLPGSVLASLRKIATCFDVNIYLAKKAMDLLGDERLVKIQHGGRTTVLAENEWKRAAILFPDTAFGHWDSIFKEIKYFLEAKGWTLELFPHQGWLDLMRRHLEEITNGDFAGIITAVPLALLKQDDEKLSSLLASGFPIIFIGGGVNCWGVDDNLYSCGYWGTKHLIEQKYKRIAFVGCRSYDGEVFIQGCRRALEEADLDDLGTGYAEDTEFALKILNNWLILDKRPDAIFYQRADHGKQ
jgi:hypothetical protein